VPDIEKAALSAHCTYDLAGRSEHLAAIGAGRSRSSVRSTASGRGGHAALEEVVMALATRPDSPSILRRRYEQIYGLELVQASPASGRSQ